jgi:protein O-mannosyl-transferase
MPSTAHPLPQPSIRLDAGLALVVFLFTFALFARTVGFEFLDVDDGTYVTENEMVQRGLTFDGIAWAFTTFHGSTWVPLTHVSLMLDRTLFGAGPSGFHFTNVFLHAISGALLFLLLVRITGRRAASLMVALLFVAHPMRAESVAWISERKDVLSAVLWWATTLAWVEWIRRRRAWIHVASLVLFAMGLSAKAMLVTLPVTLLILDRWPLRREVSWTRRIVEKIPLFVLAAAGALIAYLSQASGTAVTSLAILGPLDRVANAIVGYPSYVGRLLWPMDLAYLYPHPSFVPPYEGWSTLRIAASAAVIGAVTATAVVLARRGDHAVAAGWAWFLVTLLPVIGLVQIGVHATADRFSYIPHVGLLLAVVFGCDALVRRRPGLLRLALAAAMVLVLTSTALTVRELGHWRDSETLFRRAIAVTQDNGAAMAALGAHLARTGRMDEAREQLERAVTVQPLLAEAHADLGIVLAALGHDDVRAREHLARALEARPDHARAHVAMGNVAARGGRLVDAARHYQSAIAIDPKQWTAPFGLGRIAQVRGDGRTARMHFARALDAAPDDQARAHVQSALRGP